MRKKVSKLQSNERIFNLLSKEHSRQNIPVALKLRLSIVLEGIAGTTNYKTARKYQTTYMTINKWRNRWKAYYDSIVAIETHGPKGDGVAATDLELIRYIKEVLADKPRSGKPCVITMAQKKQIVALASENPEEYGVPFEDWTYEMLAHVAKARGIVEDISSCYVGVILKKTN
jgi:transposase